MKAVTTLALAGLASASAAQSFTIHIKADVADPPVGSTITWTVSVTGDFGAVDYVQGYDFNLVASDPGLGTASPFQSALSPLVGPTPGTPSGASIFGASGGQSSILGAPIFGPVVLGTFTTVYQAAGILSYTLEDGGILSLTNVLQIKPGSDFAPDTWNGLPNVISDHVGIPTPAGATVLLGAIAFRRRRRS
ncbi:MAG: hypothetical protein R3B49_11035 [Phycisphaerales bacterium]